MKKSNLKAALQNRRFKYGSFATLISVGFVAIIVILNIIATILVDRYPLTIDMTSEKVFQLSDETINFLKELDEDVEIKVLAKKEDYLNASEYYAQAITVLDNYQKYSNHIKIEYIDIIKDPSIVSKYPDLSLASGNILVRSDKRYKKLLDSDLFNTDFDYTYYSQYITSSKAEQVLSSAIEYVTSDHTVLASIITGHEETESAGLSKILSLINFDTVSQRILSEDINPDAQFVIINAPMRDYTTDEIKRLELFLENGGNYGKNLLYFADSEQPDLPNLEAFLEDWGIKIGDGIVYETSTNMLANAQYPFYSFTEYSSDDYTSSIKDRDLLVMMAYGRPLTTLFEGKGSISTTQLLGYSDTSYIYPMDPPEGYTPSENDEKGPFGALIRSQKLRYDGTTPLTSNVFVFSTSLAVDESITTSTVIGNAEYITEMLNTLSEKETTLNIVSKKIGSREININAAQIIVLGLVFVILLPLAVLSAGIVVWIKRRNK